jgi:hypothetical protein
MKRLILALGLFYFSNPVSYTETVTQDCVYTTSSGKTYKFQRKFVTESRVENIYPEDFSRLDMLICDLGNEIDFQD